MSVIKGSFTSLPCNKDFEEGRGESFVNDEGVGEGSKEIVLW